MVGIIDYKMGNVQSVMNAFHALCSDVQITSDPQVLERADHIVLPGVGAFGRGMANLLNLSLVEALNEQVNVKRKPFLGICLGMQVLADVGYEFGEHRGLGWIPGKVKRIKSQQVMLPHVGWNNIKLARPCPLISKNMGQTDFYFVHSYCFEPEDVSHVSAVCDYGDPFAAVVNKENIFGVQFHPEKSQKAGRCLLENFLKL
jgi:glutamine amidotransferase